jgi:uncharacterized RDD family membrane protein YckC
MNTTVSTRDLFRSLCIALVVMLALATLARAQEKPAAAAVADQPAPAAPPPAEDKTATPAAAPAPEEKSELRRLDGAPAEKNDEATTPADDKADDKNTAPSNPEAPDRTKRSIRVSHIRLGGRGNGNQIVSVGHDSHLAKGDTAEVVVSVFGSSTAEGTVTDSVVSVFGNTRVTGPVADSAVAVFGSTYVNGPVRGQVVAVFGDVELGPQAEVNGEVVSVGGTIKRDEHAITHGQVSNVSAGGAFANVEWLKEWVIQCALHGRLLAFGPNLGWAWIVALSFLVFYTLLALLFRGGIEKCEQVLISRPGYSILTALLSVLIVPIVLILLAITGIGLVLWPFIIAGVFFATLFGKAVMLAWLGRRCTGFLGGPIHPALAVLVGGVIVLGLYFVPILGLIVYKLFGWVGMGVVFYTLILGMKREKPPAPPPVLGNPLVAPASAVAGQPAFPPASAGEPPAVALAGANLPPVLQPALSLSLLPRAGFWIRMAALLLDVILVAIISSFLSNLFPLSSHVRLRADLLPMLAVYGAVMWKLKATTIGGIVLGLKVVRLDDRPIDWGTAIVRALSCFLSLVVVGLGFLWVVFDNDKQSWHDKIAGTTVVRVPKGMSLI